jgi:uncharacterized membrane protein HdeD (DUF308 family)
MKDEQKRDANPIYNLSWLIIGGLFNLAFGTGTLIFGLGSRLTLGIIAGVIFIAVGIGLFILGPLIFRFVNNPKKKD